MPTHDDAQAGTLRVEVVALGPMALAILKALGHVEAPPQSRVPIVVMRIGPVTEQA